MGPSLNEHNYSLLAEMPGTSMYLGENLPSFQSIVKYTSSHKVELSIQSKDFVQTKDYQLFNKDYTLQEKIGEGSYGRVHCAVHNVTRTMRAVKVMKLEP